MEKFQPSSFATHQAELEFLENLGFPTNTEIVEAGSVAEVWEKSRELEQNGADLSYHIDGMVIKLNDHRLATDLGVVGKTPRAWCAIKFAAEEVTTKILDVTWQVGRTGKLTPVAELEPVSLVGTVVKRATLHNYKEFLEKKLVVGDVVIVRKAGDIIPEIVQVLYNLRSGESLTELKPPENCPVCSTRLVISSTGVDLECPNKLNCRAQVLGRLAYYAQRNIANIQGLSEKLIERFVDEYTIRDLPHLYDLPYEQIAQLEGFGQKSAQNLRASIDQSRHLPDYKFLAGLAIEGVGLEVAKLICQKLAEPKPAEQFSTSKTPEKQTNSAQTRAAEGESLFG
jgi:DNA ligase (NAD+)